MGACSLHGPRALLGNIITTSSLSTTRYDSGFIPIVFLSFYSLRASSYLLDGTVKSMYQYFVLCCSHGLLSDPCIRRPRLGTRFTLCITYRPPVISILNKAWGRGSTHRRLKPKPGVPSPLTPPSSPFSRRSPSHMSMASTCSRPVHQFAFMRPTCRESSTKRAR